MNKRVSTHFYLCLAAICVIIAGCGVVIGLLLGNFKTAIFNKQEANLYELVRSVDRGIETVFERNYDELADLATREEYTATERVWLDTGEEAALRQVISTHAQVHKNLTADVLVLNGEKILSMQRREGDYSFPYGLSGERPVLCVAADGTLYLAFFGEADQYGTVLCLLMNMEAFYRNIAGDEINADDWILLYDENCSVILRTHLGLTHSDRIDAASGATWMDGGVEILMENQAAGSEDTRAYSFRDRENRLAYDDIISVYPTELNRNGVFAVGIATDCTDLYRSMERYTVWTALCIAVIVCCVVVLLRLVLSGKRKSDEARRGAEELQKKNEYMEQLIERKSELAHIERLETIGTMTAGIAHEFNNLLTPIMGYSLLSLESLGGDSGELYDNLLEIYRASQSAKELVERISELSRKGTDRELELLSPDEVLQRALETAEPAKKQGILVEASYGCRAVQIRGNRTRLVQMLLNLIINAYYAMGEEGTLTVSSALSGDRVTLTVRDTGSGIPAEVLPHIFDPFFTTKGPAEGTGLGLSIAMQTAEDHGGTISVRTEPGKGTAFFVFLPTENTATPKQP